MYTYPLRALSKNKREIVVFSLLDGPTRINETEFVLSKREHSPILLIQSITRGCDVDNLFEGDVIMEKEEYVITYRRGFSAVSLKRIPVKFQELGTYSLITNMYIEPRYNKVHPNKRLLFKCGNIIFKMWQIVDVDTISNTLLLNISGGLKINFADIQQYAEMKYEGRSLYFGDRLKGEQLTLNNGSCGIFYKNKWVDFTDIEELD